MSLCQFLYAGILYAVLNIQYNSITMNNFYELLGVNSNATNEQIKKAYKEKAKLYHPDKNGSSEAANEMLKMINKAKDTLLDSVKRLAYDYKIGIKTKQGLFNTRKVVGWGLLAFIAGLVVGGYKRG